MPHKLTEKALLFCNRGTTPSELKVTSQDFSKFENKLIATEQDKQGETNIQSFGVCTVTLGRCTPKPGAWQQSATLDEINGYKILTESSSCQCNLGGKITPQFNGHGGQSEINADN